MKKNILKAIGFNFHKGIENESIHPFSISFFHPGDVRITVCHHTKSWISNILHALHEGGHALYEQNIDERLKFTLLCEAISLGIHESQSRFWENHIGKNINFWEFWLPELKRAIPRLNNIKLIDFWKGINKVYPNFIRIESDEVTYNLHIILRIEIEKELIEGKIKVKDIPEVWNEKMKNYLGIIPPNDSLGALQDIHWAWSMFGYFPTYLIGDILAAQIFHKISRIIPDLENKLKNCFLEPITGFLNNNLHKYGKTLTAAEAISNLTGENLNIKYFKEHLEKRFSQVYEF